MHPDLFMIVYRQQECELEQRLRQRLAIEERGTLPGVAVTDKFRSVIRAVARLRERTRFAAPDVTCCAAA
ncbi:hypothetical protein E3T23_14395 [Cryobacterium cheniae]|uniref:Uncharacterized protein n=1 Tax=Cryobacterium cheniae TaxID=1259262 RepID=A0A4R8XK36_9MICO|nr:hypothetical protein [Cryobacterium cheniae]TFC76613.1 hypothetical protein E3T23_14395 [Cryobacterium cheniae]